MDLRVVDTFPGTLETVFYLCVASGTVGGLAAWILRCATRKADWIDVAGWIAGGLAGAWITDIGDEAVGLGAMLLLVGALGAGAWLRFRAKDPGLRRVGARVWEAAAFVIPSAMVVGVWWR